MAIRMMKAGVYAGPGNVVIESRPVPTPGTGEALVRVRACGICGSDVSALKAEAPEMAPGTILGHEAAGVVEAVADGVSGYSGGERVVLEPLLTCGKCVCCASGRDSICRHLRILGVHTDGAFAEYVVVPARRLYRIPDSLDFRLASLTEPTSVAVHGLRVGGFRPGMRVLVQGAGVIGLAAVAAARAWGAEEILLSARYPHQAEIGRACGATRVLGEEQSTASALDATGRETPIGMVVDTVGHADTLAAAGAAIEPGGTVVELGLTLAPVPIDALTLLHKEARLQWANCYYPRESGRSDFEESLRLIQQRPALWSAMLSCSVPLEEIRQGFAVAGNRKAGTIKATVMMD
jgi:threonine dehydrogenase-like Zn-dependent dehydrogenase